VDGGKVTLRLVSKGDVVEYDGELSASGQVSKIVARVTVSDGGIDVSALGEVPPPEWLVAFVRATLRSAWRSSAAGVPWPRRVSRWRKSTDGETEG
jgi:hypothetical protein